MNTHEHLCTCSHYIQNWDPLLKAWLHSATSSQKPHRVPLSYFIGVEPWWHCKKAVYCRTKLAISCVKCVMTCVVWKYPWIFLNLYPLLLLLLFFQAVPAADPAHILWRGCHGSALCHCWLNMEETPSLALPNTKTHHWRDILYSTNPSYLVFLIHGNFILIKLGFVMSR